MGGARSGKSRYAEQLAAQIAVDEQVLYVATARAEDDEMRARVAAHRAQRPAGWTTIEAPEDPAGALFAHPQWRTARVVLIDCITNLVANLMVGGAHDAFDPDQFDAPAAEARAVAGLEALLAAYHQGQAIWLLVSNEVGMGVVPPYPLGRAYRDTLGRINARLADAADRAALLVAGQPLDLKALAASWEAHLLDAL